MCPACLGTIGVYVAGGVSAGGSTAYLTHHRAAQTTRLRRFISTGMRGAQR